MNQTITSSQQRSLGILAQAGLLAGPFLSILDSNIVTVALPNIANQLHTSLDTVQWVVSGYLLALAAVLAASAYLAKRFGTLRVYLVSMIGFTLASALCALAPTIGILIAARALQGAVAAPLVPLAMSMLLGGGEARKHISPAAGILMFLAPALGPTIGGILINISGWSLIFLINIPFGIVGVLGVLRLPPQTASRRNPNVHFDPFGIVLLGSGLVLTIYGATQAVQLSWTAATVWPYLVSGIVLLIVYVIWALRSAHPAVDLKLLRHVQTALAVALCALTSVVLFAVLFLLPVFLEDLQGFSLLTAGLVMLPQGLVTGVGTILGSQLSKRWGIRASTMLGMVILTVGTAALLLVTLDTPPWITALILSGRGFALGLTIQPLLNMMIGGLSSSEVPDGNTLFNVAERLGGSIGIPLLATFFTVREATRIGDVLHVPGLSAGAGQSNLSGIASHLPAFLRTQVEQAAVSGFHDTIWLLVGISALGFCAALLLREHRTESTSEEGAHATKNEALPA